MNSNENSNQNIYMNNNEKSSWKLQSTRIMYVINLLILLPIWFPVVPHITLTYILFLRLFYIPYISTVLLTIIYRRLLKKYECSGLEMTFFHCSLVLSIATLARMEIFYLAITGAQHLALLNSHKCEYMRCSFSCIHIYMGYIILYAPIEIRYQPLALDYVNKFLAKIYQIISDSISTSPTTI